MQEIELHTLLSQLLLLACIPTYIVTRYVIVAPFGRHAQPTNDRWWFRPKFDARLSWCIFESPNLVWAAYCFFCWRDPAILFANAPDESSSTPRSPENNPPFRASTNAILLSLFALHYVNRAIVYPLRMNPNANKVPLVVSASAFAFTSWNGYLQCSYLVRMRKLAPLTLSFSSSSMENARTWMGIFLFLAGMGINVRADGVLRNLREHGGGGGDGPAATTQQRREAYRIPPRSSSRLFAYVSCPNLGGEILEWFGYACASGFSLPSVAFFAYTASNLIPRAVAHHEWYLRKFEDYPKERRWAAIPFVV